MIKDPKRLQVFNDALSRANGPVPHQRALGIFSSLWQEGIALGVLPPKDPLEGIETDVRIARILNSCSKSLSLI